MKSISTKQASMLLFLCLAGDIVVQPFGVQQTAAAQPQSLAAVAQTLFLLAVVWLLARFWPVQPPSVAAVAVFGVVCLFGAAAVLLRTEQFYRYASDEPLPATVTVALLLACVAYALSCHNQSQNGHNFDTASRVGGLLFWMFCATLILLAVASIPAMQLTNLAPAKGISAVFTECMRSIQLPVDLLICWILCRDDARTARSGFGIAVLGAGALRFALAIGTELVVGSNTQGHAQLLHTLTRIGGISVFKRLDALHGSMWLLLLLLKMVVLFTGAQIALSLLWKCKNMLSIGVLFGTFLPCAMLLTVIPQTTHATLLSGGVFVVFVCIWIQGGLYAKRAVE